MRAARRGVGGAGRIDDPHSTPRLNVVGYPTPQLNVVGYPTPRLNVVGYPTPRLNVVGYPTPRLSQLTSAPSPPSR
jgi:hypothetical protein